MLIQLEAAGLNHGLSPVFSDKKMLVGSGDKILIKGASGSGKTSLFKVLLGFETLDCGMVLFDGKPITSERIHDIRDQIFYLSQDIDFKNEPVGPMLDRIFTARNKIISSERLSAQLEFFELDDTCLEKATLDLSGGERQRMGLLIGFALDCPIWLLDEPTSALEDRMKLKIADAIMKNAHTILIISHDSVWEEQPDITIHRWA